MQSVRIMSLYYLVDLWHSSDDDLLSMEPEQQNEASVKSAEKSVHFSGDVTDINTEQVIAIEDNSQHEESTVVDNFEEANEPTAM